MDSNVGNYEQVNKEAINIDEVMADLKKECTVQDTPKDLVIFAIWLINRISN